MLYCLENGIAIPDDVALVGFSGLQMGQALPKALTTINTPRYEIGRIAARKILNSFSDIPINKVTDVGFELISGQTS